MFSPSRINDVFRGRTLPIVEVTEAEFVAKFMAIGASEEEAKLQAKVSRIMGAETVCGNERLRIKQQ